MPNAKYVIMPKDSQIVYGKTLYRIKALMDFGSGNRQIKKGDLGGYIESEYNLSANRTCWIAGDACVFGKAQVLDDGFVCGNATVKDNAMVGGYALISGYAYIQESAGVTDHADIGDYATVSGHVLICDSASLMDHCRVYDKAIIQDNAIITGKAQVYGTAKVGGTAKIDGEMKLSSGTYETTPKDLDRKQIPALKDKLSQGLKGISKEDWSSRDYKEANTDA